MSAEKLSAFLQVFSQLPQRVVWKWEGGKLPGQPKNIMVAKWLPQSDILCKYVVYNGNHCYFIKHILTHQNVFLMKKHKNNYSEQKYTYGEITYSINL